MNAIIAEKEKSEVVEFRAPGPGERLRNARVSQDMDIVKAAAKLHLTTDMVDAIECDDYSELPARVFVRGYIRNYARLVDLPVDSILLQFDELWPEDEHKVKVENAPRLPADPRPGNNWASGITWLLLISGLVLFLVWWQGYLDRFSPQGTEPVAADQPVIGDADSPDGELNLPVREVDGSVRPTPLVSQGSGMLALPKKSASAVPVSPPPVSQTDSAPQAEQMPQGLATARQESAIALPPMESNPRSVAQNTPPTTRPQVEPGTESDVATAPVQPPAAAAETTPPTPQSGVVVRFTEDCWVDIRDSTGGFKLFGTRRAGSEELLGGSPPYRFVLGNAAGVNVSIDGEAYDLQTHTRNNVARFTLNP